VGVRRWRIGKSSAYVGPNQRCAVGPFPKPQFLIGQTRHIRNGSVPHPEKGKKAPAFGWMRENYGMVLRWLGAMMGSSRCLPLQKGRHSLCAQPEAYRGGPIATPANFPDAGQMRLLSVSPASLWTAPHCITPSTPPLQPPVSCGARSAVYTI
jgi:hypothetical protein